MGLGSADCKFCIFSGGEMYTLLCSSYVVQCCRDQDKCIQNLALSY